MASEMQRHGLLSERFGVDYWAESRQPLTSLVFVTPLLVIYELGVLMLGPAAVRNGADVWLRRFLELLDFGQYFLLPALTVCILLGWHYVARRPWRVSRAVLFGMAIESLGLAICLRIILQVQATAFQRLGGLFAAGRLQVVADLSGAAAELIGFFGAGIYEELLFRLILLSLVAWAMRRLGATPRASTVAATLATSFLFAAAHYIGPYGDPVQLVRFAFWFGFLFRFLAGVFFSALFVYRGFGVAAGAHAGYDILVKLW